MKLSTIGGLALAAVSTKIAHAAQYGDQVCNGPLCIAAIYDDQALQVEYTAAYKGSVGWVGVGQGSRMAGANIMVGWPTNGQVVMSQRYTTSHAQPSTGSITAKTFIANTTASTTNSSVTVLSWTFPVASGFATSKTAHIWAYSATSPGSSDPSASIREHDKKGTTYLDLTKQLSTSTGSGSNPIPSSSNSNFNGNGNGNGNGDAGSANADEQGSGSAVANRDLSDRTTQMYLAHMIFMTVAWFVLIAAGILVGRFGRVYFPSSWFRIHRIIQVSALILIVIGFALGYSAVEREGGPHFQDTHNKVGLVMFILVIIQAFWGQIGHLIFCAKHIRLQNYGHILLGVVLFFGLALYQARTGFQAWEWMAPDWIQNILYPVWFGIITLAFLAGLALLPRERRTAAARTDLQRIRSDQEKFNV